jgi:superfamily II DNA/RNA helicase
VTTTFEALGVAPELVRTLTNLDITDPFPIQALTIVDGLAGRDVCGKAKTGSGKTLAFGLPLLQRCPRAEKPGRPKALVLVPTRELAGQVGDVLRPLAGAVERRLAVLYGGTGLDRQVRTLQQGVDVAVATPGRLIDLVQRGVARLDTVEITVLDEADRMVDMGFLPQVEWLLRQIAGPHQTMLFSATLDGDVDSLIRHHLRDPVRHEVASTRPTVRAMAHRFLAVHELDKPKVVATISQPVARTLVFTRTKRGADRLTQQLRRDGVRAGAIHGDLRQIAREKMLADFIAGRLPVLVATDVAARGLHVEGIDVVIHYDPPEDQKAYLHRSGRTARAGEIGMVVTLVLWNQKVGVERIQHRLGIDQPIVEVFSNDPRLGDLHAWNPGAAAPADSA